MTGHDHRPRRVTVLGGGNGISCLLRGLAREQHRQPGLLIRAVVATADDGGSSGRLRKQRGGLPPGDLRNCLLALAGDANPAILRLFRHRFQGQGEIGGHSLGNLLIAAFAEQEGCYLGAVQRAAEMLDARGVVLPVSLQSVVLEGETSDGRRLSGESTLGDAPCALGRVWLEPADAPPAPGVLEAITDSDLVIIGPGSLFTSLLAVLQVRGVVEAIRASRGRRVLVANLMTQPGETVGMNLRAHMETLDRHVGPGLVDDVLVHDDGLTPARLEPYSAVHAAPVDGKGSAWKRSERRVEAELTTRSGKIRHDPDRLVRALWQIYFAGLEERGGAEGRHRGLHPTGRDSDDAFREIRAGRGGGR